MGNAGPFRNSVLVAVPAFLFDRVAVLRGLRERWDSHAAGRRKGRPLDGSTIDRLRRFVDSRQPASVCAAHDRHRLPVCGDCARRRVPVLRYETRCGRTATRRATVQERCTPTSARLRALPSAPLLTDDAECGLISGEFFSPNPFKRAAEYCD